MTFSMKAEAGGDFKQPTPGSVGAVCTRIIDMGTQETFYGSKRRVLLSFELDELMSDGRPFLVSSSYTLSFHEKSKLRGDLESWRGKKFADGEQFELPAILGKPALLNLVLSDKGYTNIVSVAPLPKGMQPLTPAGELLSFNLDEPDWDTFNALSEKLQEKIASTPEYKRTPSGVAPAKPTQAQASQSFQQPAVMVTPEPSAPLAADFDDEIPF